MKVLEQFVVGVFVCERKEREKEEERKQWKK